ncbi:MAG: YfjI family protein, partial [Pirellulales bacterium]
EWRPFPVAVLPEPIGGFVRAAAKALGCDTSYVGLPILSALASAIGNSRRILLKPGWLEPPILWTAIIGKSGTLKSPAMELALRPVRERQRRHFQEHDAAMLEYEQALEEYEHAKRSKGGGPRPERPARPICRRTWVDDLTTEGLAVILQENLRGVLCAKDELSAWFGGFDRYAKGGKGSDAARWLEMYGGRSLVIDRKTDRKTIRVERAAVCLTGGIQPAILARALTPEYFASGLAARVLLACPPVRAKKWSEAVVPQEIIDQVGAVFNRLYALDGTIDADGNQEPKVLALTREAKVEWVRFHDGHGREMSELDDNEAALWSKLEGVVPRLALVIHLVRSASDDPLLRSHGQLDAQSILAAVELVRWFGHEGRRVYGMFAESEEDSSRRELVELVRRKGGVVTAREIQQTGPRLLRAPGAAETALEGLANAGYGTWQSSPRGQRGQPTRRFVLATVATCYGNTLTPERNDNTVSVASVAEPGNDSDDPEPAPIDGQVDAAGGRVWP